MGRIRYKRVLIKLSGEALATSKGLGVSMSGCLRIAKSIKALSDHGVQVGVVVGGGNIVRGGELAVLGLARSPADQMGMLATMINGLALQQALCSIGRSARVLSAVECPKIVDFYGWSQALDYLNSGVSLIFVGGTGNPYFTTDTAAALRANEINADILLKATKVDGVYDKDPKKNADAVKYDRISYSEVLAKGLEVMDAAAIAMCRTSGLPVVVFNMDRLIDVQILSLLSGKNFGTLITED